MLQLSSSTDSYNIKMESVRFLDKITIELFSRRTADDVLSKWLERWSKSDRFLLSIVKIVVFSAFFVRTISRFFKYHVHSDIKKFCLTWLYDENVRSSKQAYHCALVGGPRTQWENPENYLKRKAFNYWGSQQERCHLKNPKHRADQHRAKAAAQRRNHVSVEKKRCTEAVQYEARHCQKCFVCGSVILVTEMQRVKNYLRKTSVPLTNVTRNRSTRSPTVWKVSHLSTTGPSQTKSNIGQRDCKHRCDDARSTHLTPYASSVFYPPLSYCAIPLQSMRGHHVAALIFLGKNGPLPHSMHAYIWNWLYRGVRTEKKNERWKITVKLYKTPSWFTPLMMSFPESMLF